MISPRQYAEQIGKPYTTVMGWLQNQILPGAVKVETPTGHVWSIPSNAKPPETKAGWPKGRKRSEAATPQPKPAKKATKKGN